MTSEITLLDQPESNKKLLSKIHELIPELRRQLECEVHEKLHCKYKSMSEEAERNIKETYMGKLHENVSQSQINIKHQLADLTNLIQKQKTNIQAKHDKKQKYELQPQEKLNLIDETIDKILEDQHILEEIKAKKMPVIEEQVRLEFERSVASNLERYKEELNHKIKKEREEWEEQRIEFWKERSNEELEVVAAEHNELMKKKALLEGAFKARKEEKGEWEQKYHQINQRNSQIAQLCRELKILQVQINEKNVKNSQINEKNSKNSQINEKNPKNSQINEKNGKNSQDKK